jgi:hypothetical protein
MDYPSSITWLFQSAGSTLVQNLESPTGMHRYLANFPTVDSGPQVQGSNRLTLLESDSVSLEEIVRQIRALPATELQGSPEYAPMVFITFFWLQCGCNPSACSRTQ